MQKLDYDALFNHTGQMMIIDKKTKEEEVSPTEMQNDYGFESFTDEPRMSDEESYTLVSEQNSKPRNNFFKGYKTDR